MRRARMATVVAVALAFTACADAPDDPDVASVLERRREDVLATLRDFASANEDARTSPNLRCESADEMRGAFALLTDARCSAS